MIDDAKSYPEMRREFYEKYAKKIVPLVKRFESTRKIKLLFAALSSGFLVSAASFILIYGFVSIHTVNDKSFETILKTAFTLYGLAFYVWFRIKKSFENSIKEKIMPTVCECFGKMKWYNGKYSEGVFFNVACVIPYYTSETYDDIFEGLYKNVNIEIVESKYTAGSGKNRRTVFDGVIIKLNMNKNFTGHTVIKQNSILHSSPSKELHYTELEDVQFNKKFDVFTNDDVEARYLITPSFMERLKKIKTAFTADNIRCAFFDEYLIIALETSKDLFSLCSLVKPIDDSKQYFTMYEEIVSILKLIDHFKLNQNIGL